MQIAASPQENARGKTLIERGDAEDARHESRAALASYAEADQLEPNRVDVLLRLSKQYSDLVPGAEDTAEAKNFARLAVDSAKRAAGLAPENSKAHLSLAIAYGRMADYEDNKTKIAYSKLIKEEAQRAIALDPAEDYAYHVLGRWHFEMSRLNPVLRLLAKAVYGDLPPASTEEAIGNLRKAVETAPQKIPHRYELARAYTALGQDELAREQWEKILQLPAADSEDEKSKKAAREALGR